MKKSRILALGLSVLMVGAMTGSALAAPRGKILNQRQCNQAQRIQQGLRSGQLTRPEAYKLTQNQMKINRYERIARADGRITPLEYKKLSTMQNRQNTAIYKEKNDRQNRY
jgi:hypothetical protein